MKKVLIKGLALAFVGSLAMAGSALALPTSADYWTFTDFTTAIAGESTVTTVSFALTSDFVGSFGLYSVDLLGSPTAVADNEKMSIFNYPISTVDYLDGAGSVSVYFNNISGDWFASTDLNWADTNNLLLHDRAFGFYFTDAALEPDVTYFTDSQFNSGSQDVIFIDWDGTSKAKIGLDANLDGIYDPKVAASDVAPVPEPATMLLFGSGLVGLAGYGRKKIAKK
jgi:hypothetical protein